MKILYINGAKASKLSFNYIKSQLPHHEPIFIEYDVNTPLSETIDIVKNEIDKHRNLNIISHSLGGVIALSSAKYPNVNKIITLSSPFGGSQFADFMRITQPSNQMFKDISTLSPTIMMLTKPEKIDVLSIVTTGGETSLMVGKNDGVVTFESQTKIKDIIYKEFDLNHFEVLLSDDVVKEIKGFLFDV